MQSQTQDQRKGKRALRITEEKNAYSKESNNQRDQKRIHFTLSNRCEDELVVVVPSPFRACSLQFSNDWHISQLGRSWTAEKRQDQRPLSSNHTPPPPVEISDVFFVRTDSYSSYSLRARLLCCKGQEFFRLERMPSILPLHRRQLYTQCVQCTISKKKKIITWPRVTVSARKRRVM